MIEFEYNAELLLLDVDRESVERSFGDIAFALVHPALCKEFKHYDGLANREKARSHRLGMTSVALATSALVMTAFEPSLHQWVPEEGPWHHLPKLVAVLAALLGLASALIAYFGLLFNRSKEDWLHHRLITERLRQWHAQSIVGQLATIVAAARSEPVRQAFLKRREAIFEEFKLQFIRQVGAELPEFLGGRVDASDAAPAHLTWIRPEWAADNATLALAANDPIVRQVFDAYRRMRIRAQVQYTSQKLLSTGVPFKSHAGVQKRVLRNLGWTCVSGLIFLHILIVIGVLSGVDWMASSTIHAAAVSTAIFALAGRTLEEGLQPNREIERLEAYRARLNEAALTFDRASSVREQLGAMRDVETASVSEMIGFLRRHHESTFVM
jgi:hypothetical protein